MKLLLAAFLTFATLGNPLNAQENSQTISNESIIVMVNTASWCPACKANGQRIEEDVVSSYKDNEHFSIVVNDLSNKASKKASLPALEKLGIENLAKKTKTTGMIYFIDPQTKTIVKEISVTKSTEEIKQAFDSFVK